MVQHARSEGEVVDGFCGWIPGEHATPVEMAVVGDRVDSLVEIVQRGQVAGGLPRSKVGPVWAYHLATIGEAEALEIAEHPGIIYVG